MPRTHTSAAKSRRTQVSRKATLALVPAATPPRGEPREPRCLLLQGFGHPDCPEFYLAVEAMEGVAQVLRQAMARTGYAADGIGQVEKSWTHRREDKVWQWKVRVLMPSSITASALELAKHMAERNEFIEPICLVPVRGYTVH